MEKQLLEVIAGSLEKPLVIGEVKISCFVLSNKARVISQQGLRDALGFSRRGGPKSTGAEISNANGDSPKFSKEKAITDVNLPGFLSSNWLRPYISEELLGVLKSPIRFNYRGLTYGYPATILADLCEAILEAEMDGATTSRQAEFVRRSHLLMTGFARVGVIGLVDEATGYQEVRENLALAQILEQYIADDLQKWNKTFPKEFYEEIYRLQGWEYPPKGGNFPQFLGHYTNHIVYSRIAPGVLKELRDKNPTLPSGNRAVKHHQYLTPNYGHPKLREHLASVIALMKSSYTWTSFQGKLDQVHPTIGTNMRLPFIEFDIEE